MPGRQLKYPSYRILIAILLLITSAIIFLSRLRQKPSPIEATWAPTASSWSNRKQLTIANNSGANLSTNTTYSLTLNTKDLYDSGLIQSDCADIRFYYQPDSTTATKLDYYIEIPSDQTCATSTATTIHFPLQADLTNGSTSPYYYLYFSNSDATSESSISAFDIGDKNATFYCGFKNTTTCINTGGTVPPTTASGAIRYSSPSAIILDGNNDKINLGSPNSLDNILSGQQVTFESWIYLNGKHRSHQYWFSTQRGSNQAGWWSYWGSGIETGRFDIYCSTQNALSIPNNTLPQKEWFHYAVTYDDTGDRKIHIHVNGTEVTYSTQNECQGNINDYSSYSHNIWGSEWSGASQNGGSLDEFRISSTIRYTTNFTPQTTPFVRDEFTKLLLHFDENGDDPRNTGKAIDDSGNNNHGTITGAKYVAGIVGINSSTLDSGTLPSQSYASHGGIFLEEGTTNLITNPSFEHSTYDTNWSIGAGCTASVNTTAPFFKFGNNSIKLIATADTDVTTSINPGSTAVHTLSAYVYDYTTGNIGGTISSSVAQLVFNGSAIGTTYTDTGGGWWRLSVGATTGSGSLNYGVQVKSGKTVYIDGVQLEQKTYQTTYTDGSLGTGYSWSNIAHESSSSRILDDLKFMTSTNIDNRYGTISLWTKKYNWDKSLQPASSGAKIISEDFGSDFYFSVHSLVGLHFRYSKAGNYISYNSNSLNTYAWHHLVVTWDGDGSSVTEYRMFVDGTEVASKNNLNEALNTITELHIGYMLNGTMSDLRIFNDSFSSTEVTNLYYSGLASHQIQTDYTSRYTDGQPPVAYWKLDEGVGSTINDSVSSNHGSLSTGDSAPTWVSGSSCISNNCLSFDGTDDYATVLPTITGLRAISFWLKPTATTTSVLGLNSTQTISITENVISANGFSSPTIYINGQNTTSLNPDEWSHILITSSTSFAVGNLTLGKVSANYFSGYLDEIKLYSYIPTDTEIKKDINLGYSASFGHSPQTDQITPLKSKLIAHYKFDEGYGTTYHDSSTNNYTASGGGSTKPTWTSDGKVSKALNFNGTNYLSCGDADEEVTTDISVSLWVNPNNEYGTGSNPGLISKRSGSWGGIWVNSSSGKLWGRIYESDGGQANLPSNSILPTNSWSHIILVASSQEKLVKQYLDTTLIGSVSYDGTILNGTDSLIIGAQAGEYLKGLIDEVKIYNYALSNSEILQDYNQGMTAIMGKSDSDTGSTAPAGSSSQEYCVPGSTDPCSPPIAEWNFDEGVGATAFDISGNNNHGVFGSGSSAPSWTMGKIGTGLNFDGTDFIHSQSNSNIIGSSPFTISTWVNTANTNDEHANIYKYVAIQLGLHSSSTGNSSQIQIMEDRISYSGYGIPGCSYTPSSPINGQWIHVSATYNSSVSTLYINGQYSCQYNATYNLYDTVVYIGHYNAGDRNYQGKLDQVRIYNYARTPAQIAWDYNRGKPIAHYKLDETDDSTAHDSSGNNLHSTLGSGDSSPTWTTGKLNNSSSFDGNDFISIGSTLSNIQSVSFWAKPNSTTQYLLQLNSSNYVQLSSGVVSVTGFSTPTVYIDGTVSTSFPDTNWHHITIVGSTIFTANQTIFGKISTNFYSGLLDDVRIYNYALTDKQVQTIYNNGAVSFN